MGPRPFHGWLVGLLGMYLHQVIPSPAALGGVVGDGLPRRRRQDRLWSGPNALVVGVWLAIIMMMLMLLLDEIDHSLDLGEKCETFNSPHSPQPTAARAPLSRYTGLPT